jgi:hypothetical protein
MVEVVVRTGVPTQDGNLWPSTNPDGHPQLFINRRRKYSDVTLMMDPSDYRLNETGVERAGELCREFHQKAATTDEHKQWPVSFPHDDCEVAFKPLLHHHAEAFATALKERIVVDECVVPAAEASPVNRC